MPDLITDEAAPLGADAGPNPSRLLVAAVANCLAASLLFALRKFKNEPGTLRATREGHDGPQRGPPLARGAGARWTCTWPTRPDALEHLDRILGQFEDFCIVTQSVREGVEVDVRVHDAAGKPLH